MSMATEASLLLLHHLAGAALRLPPPAPEVHYALRSAAVVGDTVRISKNLPRL